MESSVLCARHGNDFPVCEKRLTPEGASRGSERICRGPLVEVIGLFAGIMLYIWCLRAYAPWLVLVLFAYVVVSHRVRNESAPLLGLGLANLRQSARLLTPYLLAIIATIFSVGMLLHSFRNITLRYGLFRLGLYLAWGLFQQYLLNGYFARRIEAALPHAHPVTIALVTSVIFTAVHLPNTVLMLVTFAAGFTSVLVFLRFRTIYFLGIAHGIIGFLMIYCLPYSMRIGPALVR
jgi:hypothetical protein